MRSAPCIVYECIVFLATWAVNDISQMVVRLIFVKMSVDKIILGKLEDESKEDKYFPSRLKALKLKVFDLIKERSDERVAVASIGFVVVVKFGNIKGLNVVGNMSALDLLLMGLVLY